MENQHTKKVADKVDEVLRVLDNNGNPTNKFVTRQYAHNNGIFHQEVAFIPVNSGGGILLQRRSKNKKSHPNCWGLCAWTYCRKANSVTSSS